VILLDSNILIYIGNHTLDRSVVAGVDISFASISKIETLGYRDILVQEERIINALLEESHVYPLTDAIIDRSVILRQMRRMGLGDAIIAATALVEDAELWTANEVDFAGIEGLRVHNPLRFGS
jgi:predicted nucleic acid-binding protein